MLDAGPQLEIHCAAHTNTVLYDFLRFVFD